MKTSYVHVQTPHGRSLGFSAKLLALQDTLDEPELEYNDKGDAMCYIAITYCNKKDKHFCKRTAREELASKPEEWVRCRDVPKMLAAAHRRCVPKPAWFGVDSYNYILGRFL